MSYNLTPKQKDLLRWVVGEVRSGELEEEFIVVFTSGGTSIAGYGKATMKVPQLTKSDLKALAMNALISLEVKQSGNCSCALLQSAYDVVDHDFADLPYRAGVQNIGNIIHNMYSGNLQGVGNATNSSISQSVNDPATFIDGINALCRDLLIAVGNHLNRDDDKNVYNAALNRLQEEAVSTNPDHSLIRKILGTLSLTADVYASYELMAKALPLVNSIALLLAARFGG